MRNGTMIQGMVARKFFILQRRAHHPGVSEQSAAQRPVTKAPEPLPVAAQSIKRQDTMCKHHRLAGAVQMHFTQQCLLPRRKRQQLGFIGLWPRVMQFKWPHREINTSLLQPSCKRTTINQPTTIDTAINGPSQPLRM